MQIDVTLHISNKKIKHRITNLKTTANQSLLQQNCNANTGTVPKEKQCQE